MVRFVPIQPRADAPDSHRRVFAALERTLGDGWLVVHRPSWLGKARADQPLLDGACDFLCAHPDFGILCLEVEEGGLQYEPSSDRWSRLNKDGQRTRCDDPYRRGRDAVRLLVAKLAQHPAALPSRPAHGHGVLLVDTVAPTRGFGPHAPAEITLDRRDLDRPGPAIERLARHWQATQPAVGNASSRWWWQALEDQFLMPREARLLLRHRLDDEQQQMVALSPQQLAVLDMLARVRRQAILGPAGTGKTLLAVHKARLLAAQGERVLLTCYNKALGHHLRAVLAAQPLVRALHFHELCYELLGLDPGATVLPEDPDARQRFFDVELAERVQAQALRQFDALVVDEAQDFLPAWWQALDSLLVDPARAVRYVFFDEAQQLRPDAAAVPGADAALVLSTNWRNTGRIHAHLAGIEPTLQAARCVAPPGAPVQLEPLTPTPARALKRVLGAVVADGAVRPEDVVVLTGSKPERSWPWRAAAELAPVRLTLTDEPGCVRLRGVQAFKGMESPVVLLADLQGRDRQRQLHYIGASRATNLLVVFADAEVSPCAVV